MARQFINDDFLPRMFVKGTNDFKEIQGESHYVEEVGFTITLLGVETEDKYLVALYGLDAVNEESEGIYLFDDKSEAERFYQEMLRQHYHSSDDYEFEDG
jgi:hypothetical protein